MICTTLARIHAHGLNEKDLAKLLGHLGVTTPVDVPVSLASILESNGVGNALWCLRTCDGVGQFASFFTLDLAWRVYPIWRARYPADTRLARHLETAAKFLHGKATHKELEKAAMDVRAVHENAADASRRAAFAGATETGSTGANSALATVSAAIHAVNMYYAAAIAAFVAAEGAGTDAVNAYNLAYMGGGLASFRVDIRYIRSALLAADFVSNAAQFAASAVAFVASDDPRGNAHECAREAEDNWQARHLIACLAAWPEKQWPAVTPISI